MDQFAGSEAIALESLAFVESVKSELGSKALHRAVEQIDEAYPLWEQGEAHDDDLGSESEPLRLENAVSWDENAETADIKVVRPLLCRWVSCGQWLVMKRLGQEEGKVTYRARVDGKLTGCDFGPPRSWEHDQSHSKPPELTMNRMRIGMRIRTTSPTIRNKK